MEDKKTNIFSMLVLLFFISATFSFAVESDTIHVPVEYEGEFAGSLNRFIMGDTIAGGERRNPNAIYILKRGEMYDCNFPLSLNFSFHLRGEAGPANVRPAMIIRGIKEDGTYIKNFFRVNGNSLDITFENFILQGIRDDEDINATSVSPFYISADSTRFVMDSCIINGATGNVVYPRHGTNDVYIFTNNVFRNSVPLNKIFSGTIWSSKATVHDTAIFRNNTFLNVSSQIILSIDDDVIRHFEFVHNTILNTSVNGIWCPYLVDGNVSDNIFINWQTAAESEYETAGGYYDKHGNLSSICKSYPLTSTQLAIWGKTESERKVIYRNNVYYWSSELKEYWANNTDEAHGGLPLTPPSWINDESNGYFNDKTTYPNYVNEDNEEMNPGIDTTIADEILDKELPFVKVFRKYGNDGLVGKTKERIYCPNYDAEKMNMFDLDWPLPEDLSYPTTSPAYTHGQNGYPVGNLNYFPDKKAEWEVWYPTGIESRKNIEQVKEYKLSQNYPNPFNPTTNIAFSIPVSGNVVLSVYNILGQKVATLVDAQLSAGSYEYKFDGANFSSGVYFYQLQSANNTQIKKMMLLK